ncbi:phage tail-collar fiber domain-containing protein [Vibrio casei]|uniref:phage tail-collar fiber domain-containing protein n=1 Tax=Vibrio casei TaxID=673372 RepID=UPI003F95F049
MADLRCYLTMAGIAAENNAKKMGTTLKITEMVFDGTYLEDNKNPEDLVDVINPVLPVPCSTSISEDGQTLTLKGQISVEQGGFNVWGIGLKTKDGVLYGYARSKGDRILTQDEGATESVRYAADILTKNADVIEIKVEPTSVYADLEYVDDRVNQILNMMKKMEGQLGRVRIYMANDIDDDYLPILGQTLIKSEYPDYFAHLGITGNSLTLPDWTKHPYLHQAGGGIAAGTTLEQQLLKHAHDASSKSTGEHAHTVDNTDLGTKTVSTKDLGTKTTNTTGAHSHTYVAPPHGYNSRDHGDHPGTEGHDETKTTSNTGNHNHTVVLGSHNHTVALGAHNHTVQEAGAHEHDITVEDSGSDLLRPNSTAVVFAVKVKYLVRDIAW